MFFPEDRQSFLTDEERLDGEETKRRPTATEIEKEKSQQQVEFVFNLCYFQSSKTTFETIIKDKKSKISNYFAIILTCIIQDTCFYFLKILR